jgi:S-DNA-T family DNA segregation ATPase FtsK/SpoIIIE
MTSSDLDLIGAVALARVVGAIDANPHERALFSIHGLDAIETSAIARALTDAAEPIEVHVHPALNDGSLPPELLSEETAAHWRGKRREPGRGAIVFAVPRSEIETVGETLGTVMRLATDTLMQASEPWIEATRELCELDERDRAFVANAIAGLAQTNIVLDLRMFARFVLRLDRHAADTPVERALDATLPELRLPAGAGRFKKAGARGRLKSPSAWAKDFEAVQETTRDKLYLRDDKGVPLDRGQLRERLDALVAGLDVAEPAAAAVRALLNDPGIEPGRWTDAQKTLVEQPWDEVVKVFGPARRRAAKPLGSATIEFFDRTFPNRLEDEERHLLEALRDEGREPYEDERAFFFERREELGYDERLFGRWEKFVFRRRDEYEDLYAGLFAGIAELLRDEEGRPARPRIYARLVGADALPFWQEHNTDYACLLRERFRGLDEVLAPEIKLDFGLCWTHPWQDHLDSEVTSTSRAAREFKIELYLLDSEALPENDKPSDEALRHARKTQIVWLPPAEAIARGLADDLHEIARVTTEELQVLLLAGRFGRNPRADRVTPISLEDRSSILDVDGRSDGRLVTDNDNALDMGAAFEAAFAMLQRDGVLGAAAAAEIAERFDVFRTAYTRAVRAFAAEDGKGLADEAVLDQAKRYGELLATLRARARAGRCRLELCPPVLGVGVASNEGETPPMAIVTPWQPLRLAEAAIKARQLAEATRRLLATSFEQEVSAQVYFETQLEALERCYYPEVGLHPGTPGGRLLAETATLLGYSLLEPPTIDQGADVLFEGEQRGAVEGLLAVGKEYLALQPHQRANFSIMLYNAEAAELPRRLVERLARRIERETDMRCDLVLTHDDPQRLRRIYEQQNAAIGRELDNALGSEATRTFLSRLRVGFVDPKAAARNGEGKAVDLILMQDVIARSARLGWRPVNHDGNVDPVRHDPAHGSRRCPFDKGQSSTAQYLACPREPEPMQAYLDLLHDLLADDQTEGRHHWIPVRQIAFREDPIGRLLERTHAIGDWVVTYDAIADRRLFEENDIHIIRHLTKPDGKHNLIVSTGCRAATSGSSCTMRWPGSPAILRPGSRRSSGAPFRMQRASPGGWSFAPRGSRPMRSSYSASCSPAGSSPIPYRRRFARSAGCCSTISATG